MTQRHYYRCIDCLTVAAADGPAVYKATCGHCGGQIEHMGQVHAERLIKTGLGCPCDGRCTSARGPKCDCHCGGVNHGSGMLVPIVRDCGPVPVLKIVASRKAAAIAAEWRDAFQQLAFELERARSQQLSGDAWRRLRKLRDAIDSARESRSHTGRMKTIGDALPSYRAATVAELQSVLF